MHIFLFIALIEIIVIIGVLFWPTKTKALRNHLCIKCSKIKIINLFRVMECFPHVYINYSRDEWQQCYQNVNKPVPLCRAMYSQWNLDLYCKKRWDFEITNLYITDRYIEVSNWDVQFYNVLWRRRFMTYVILICYTYVILTSSYLFVIYSF